MKRLKTIVLILLFIGFQNCGNQTNSEVVTVEDFNWTVTIPENFIPIDEKEWDKTIKRGKDAVEKTVGEIDNQAITIFTYKNEQFNNFEANWQPFDLEIDGDYSESIALVNNIVYETFETQIPKAKLDSVSRIQKISGLEFHRFDIAIDFPNGMKMKTIGFSRLFNQKDFTMNISYIDEKIGKEMLEAFLKSKFE